MIIPQTDDCLVAKAARIDPQRNPHVLVLPQPKTKGLDSLDEPTRAVFHEVVPFEDAFARTWPTDAHFAMYLTIEPDGMADPTEQPRLNKPVRERIEATGGRVGVFVLALDFDRPDHAPWPSDADREQFIKRLLTVDLTAHAAAVYATNAGARVVFILTREIAWQQAEDKLRGLRAHYEEHGLEADSACKAWNWLFRLPDVTRLGKSCHPVDVLDAAVRLDPDDVPAGALPPPLARISGNGPAVPVTSVEGVDEMVLESCRAAIDTGHPLHAIVAGRRTFSAELIKRHGGRNQALAWAVGSACAWLHPRVDGCDQNVIAALLTQAACVFEPDAGDPDWSVTLNEMAGRFWGKEVSKPLADPVPAAAAPRGFGNGASRFYVPNLADVLRRWRAGELVTPPTVIDGLVSEGQCLLVGGPASCGKSKLLARIAVALAIAHTGRRFPVIASTPVGGMFCVNAPEHAGYGVRLVCFEPDETIVEGVVVAQRLAGLLADAGVAPDDDALDHGGVARLAHVPATSPLSDMGRDAFHEALDAEAARIRIAGLVPVFLIDNLTAGTPGMDKSDGAEVTALKARLADVQERHGVLLIIAAHLVKSAARSGSGNAYDLKGAAELVDLASAVWLVNRDEHRQPHVARATVAPVRGDRIRIRNVIAKTRCGFEGLPQTRNADGNPEFLTEIAAAAEAHVWRREAVGPDPIAQHAEALAAIAHERLDDDNSIENVTLASLAPAWFRSVGIEAPQDAWGSLRRRIAGQWGARWENALRAEGLEEATGTRNAKVIRRARSGSA